MTGSHETERRIRAWLARGPDEASGELIEAVLAELPAVRQRHGWEVSDGPVPWGRIRLVIAATLVLALLGGILWVAGAARPNRPLTWTPVLDLAPFARGVIRDVVSSDGASLATGTVFESGQQDGAFWASTDGRSWQRLPAAGAVNDLTIGRLARRGGTLVAIAYGCATAPGGYCDLSTLLVSTDGLTWRDATPSLLTCCGIETLFLTSVVAGGPGFVVAGSGVTANVKVVGTFVATSPDGLSWTGQASATSPSGSTSMTSIAEGSHGLVAVGVAGSALAAWHSADGRQWASASVEPLAGAVFTDVASDGGRYVAVGKVGARAGSWTSNDGLTWSLEPGSPALDSAAMSRVVWSGHEFVAVGTSIAGNGLAWTSPDGASWERQATGELFDNAPIVGASSLGDALVLFGNGGGGPVIAVGTR